MSPVICRSVGLLYNTGPNWTRGWNWAKCGTSWITCNNSLVVSRCGMNDEFTGSRWNTWEQGSPSSSSLTEEQGKSLLSSGSDLLHSATCLSGWTMCRQGDRPPWHPISIIVAKEMVSHVLGTPMWYLSYISYSWLYSLSWWCFLEVMGKEALLPHEPLCRAAIPTRHHCRLQLWMAAEIFL